MNSFVGEDKFAQSIYDKVRAVFIQYVANQAQKRLMAVRAAKADAFRQLVEIINGVHVNSETVVKDFVTESDVIKTKVEGLIKGIKKAPGVPVLL